MTKLWFCLLAVCFLVWPAQAQVPEPARCLISGVYSLVQQPETKDEKSCQDSCSAEPDCHMAVMTKPVSGSAQCLLVNCLSKGRYSFPRDPSAEIYVYPQSTDPEQRPIHTERGSGLVNERLRCFDSMNHSSCQLGIPRFFYNSTSYRCERFSSGCGSSRNTFETQEDCEALCNETFRCYRPRQLGRCKAQFSKFFYNAVSQRCESFVFSGCGSNGNIFTTADECESLCAGVKGRSHPLTTGTAGTSAPVTVDTTAALYFVIPPVLLLVVVFVNRQHCRCCQRPSPTSDRRHLLQESDEPSVVDS